MEAARLNAPAPSSRLGAAAAAATGGACPLLSSTPWLPCLANGVGSCCEDPLGEGLCGTHSGQCPQTAPRPVVAAVMMHAKQGSWQILALQASGAPSGAPGRRPRAGPAALRWSE